MSLTTFVEKNEVRKKIDENFPKPSLGITEGGIVAPPRTKNYTLVGTAFDYLFRFWLEANNENVETGIWIAHQSLLSLIKESFFKFFEIEKKDHTFLYKKMDFVKALDREFMEIIKETEDPKCWPSPFSINTVSDIKEGKVYENLAELVQQLSNEIELEWVSTQPALFKKVCESIARAEFEYKRYIQSGDLSDKLIEASIDLAKIDGIYRGGGVRGTLGEYENGDIEDLKKLVEVIPKEEFAKANRYLLNPTFGEASSLVGGADCDIIMDDTLIDIKTTKYLKLDIRYWRQLVGYCVLADLAKEELDYFPRIKQVGVYYSRHGRLWTTDASQIYDNSGYENFKKWFKKAPKEIWKREREEILQQLIDRRNPGHS